MRSARPTRIRSIEQANTSSVINDILDMSRIEAGTTLTSMLDPCLDLRLGLVASRQGREPPSRWT